jgi:phenylpyruvate tautomerase PptA (4-oxalocrotonate tautomerase family)
LPVIDIYHPLPAPPKGLLVELCAAAGAIVDQPPTHVWAFWHPIGPDCFERPDWFADPMRAGPLVRIRCRSIYTVEQRRALLSDLARFIAGALKVDIETLFVLLDPVNPGQLFVRGDIWE